ncbi:exopolysaccharide biosynthesis protein (plasmid) [Sulfitobacter sp. W027]|uniref:exopolysaccharide biosynthesis protein n=1 Tax=Sulfitobacter sp. W027 TaxID=2867025 RepID=UPI0021A3ECEE|nr:exopolysaccharide biosynthesis protein [Sulfitobacter sp. W027]UWR35490.1 exopolysaccharide biosynthesis protein [Sulfitobacter sp. W027]
MSDTDGPTLSGVLDQMEHLSGGADRQITVEEIINCLGKHSFASTILAFSLISTSPASGIPGVTAFVGLVVMFLVVQMIFGRDSLWLPGFIMRRDIAAKKLREGVRWLRRPVAFVDRFLHERTTFLLHRPWIYLPLIMVLLLTMFMPFMEVVPTSGSIASAMIAIFAAGYLMRDGKVVILSMVLMSLLPVGVAWFILER